MPQRPVGLDMNLSQPTTDQRALVALKTTFVCHLIDNNLVIAVSALL